MELTPQDELAYEANYRDADPLNLDGRAMEMIVVGSKPYDGGAFFHGNTRVEADPEGGDTFCLVFRASSRFRVLVVLDRVIAIEYLRPNAAPERLMSDGKNDKPHLNPIIDAVNAYRAALALTPVRFNERSAFYLAEIDKDHEKGGLMATQFSGTLARCTRLLEVASLLYKKGMREAAGVVQQEAIDDYEAAQDRITDWATD